MSTVEHVRCCAVVGAGKSGMNCGAPGWQETLSGCCALLQGGSFLCGGGNTLRCELVF